MNPSKIEIPECCKETKNPPQKIFSFQEQKTKLTLTNEHGVPTTMVEVDGCVFKGNEEKRCDFLLITNDWEIYIELKGRDYESALGQLENSIKKIGVRGKNKKAYLICTKSPKGTVEIQKIVSVFKKTLGCKLIIQSNGFKDKY